MGDASLPKQERGVVADLNAADLTCNPNTHAPPPTKPLANTLSPIQTAEGTTATMTPLEYAQAIPATIVPASTPSGAFRIGPVSTLPSAPATVTTIWPADCSSTSRSSTTRTTKATQPSSTATHALTQQRAVSPNSRTKLLPVRPGASVVKQPPPRKKHVRRRLLGEAFLDLPIEYRRQTAKSEATAGPLVPQQAPATRELPISTPIPIAGFNPAQPTNRAVTLRETSQQEGLEQHELRTYAEETPPQVEGGPSRPRMSTSPEPAVTMVTSREDIPSRENAASAAVGASASDGAPNETPAAAHLSCSTEEAWAGGGAVQDNLDESIAEMLRDADVREWLVSSSSALLRKEWDLVDSAGCTSQLSKVEPRACRNNSAQLVPTGGS